MPRDPAEKAPAFMFSITQKQDLAHMIAHLFDDFKTNGRGGEINAQANRYSEDSLIGSGPIVIGQACEFDYSGTRHVVA